MKKKPAVTITSLARLIDRFTTVQFLCYAGITIALLGIVVWFGVLNGWFLYGNEPHHLFSSGSFTLPNLIRTHSVLYFVSFILFGWNASGWYAITLFFHIFASLALFYLLLLLTKNRIIAVVGAIGFLIHTAYIDVLAWGSFNALYPVTLLIVLLSLLCFFLFKTTKNIVFYVLLFPLLIIGLINREIALVIPVVIFLLDILYFKTSIRGNYRYFIRWYGLFLFVMVGFLLFRSINGSDPADYVDERHRLRIGLLGSQQYVEYIFRGALGFFKKIPPLLIPYPWLNILRDAIAAPTNVYIQNYFFPLLGVIITGVSLWAMFLWRKKKLVHIAFFFFCIMVLFNAFFSFAQPETNTTLVAPYVWNGARYHYFAFFGFSIYFWVIVYLLSSNIKVIKAYSVVFFLGIFLAVTCIHAVFIFTLVDGVNKTTYANIKKFHADMAKKFPESRGLYFYVYPHASPLGDYLYEWNYLRSTSPEDFLPGSTWGSANVSLVFEKINKEVWKKEQVRFLDFQNNQIVDKTDEVQAVRKNIEEVTVFQPEENEIIIDKKLPVEFPYELVIRAKVDPHAAVQNINPMAKYLQDRYTFLRSVGIEVSGTILISETEPHPNFSQMNLIDGNFGKYSQWIAEDTHNAKASLILDLQEKKEIAAVWWNCPSPTTGVVTKYSIFISDDKKTWQEIRKNIQTTKTAPLEKFESTITGRYIKLDILSTAQGDPPSIDAVEVITKSGADVLHDYDDPIKLVQDATLSSQTQSSASIITGTIAITTKSKQREETQQRNILMPVDAQFHTYTLLINEGEVFSIPGEFLDRLLTKVTYSFPKNASVTVEYVTIKPILKKSL